jgi:catechol 2,3-dioxygenase-like lactoylglutathione lyase family enzyme
MPSDQVAQPWTIRSTLIAVADLDRSVAFYRELGPFEELSRDDAVAVLGEDSPTSLALILRESKSLHQVRHGQQSLGIRSITFNVGSLTELDRIESVLHGRTIYTRRQEIADGACVLLRARDPDNMPLVFVYYAEDRPLGTDYYQTVTNLVYSLDT